MNRHPTHGGQLCVLAAALLLATGCAPKPGTLIQRATRAAKAGDHGRACRLLTAALAHRDIVGLDRLHARRALVRCAHRLGRLGGVVARAKTDLSQSPEDAEAHYTLAMAILVSANGQRAAAIRHLRAARRSDPGQAEYPHRQGQIELASERFKEASAALAVAVRLKPAWAPPRIALARAFTEQGRFAKAREVLGELPKCRPTTDEVRRATTIIATIARYTDPIPPAAQSLFRKAMNQLDQEFTAAAAQTLKQAHLRYPHVAAFALLYGLTQIRLSNYGAAIALLRKAARLNPQDFSPPLHLAEVLLELGRTAEAIPLFRRASQRNPVSRRALRGLGSALIKRGKTVEALPTLRRAAALSGRSAAALRSLARALIALGKLGEATGILRDAVRWEPANLDAQVDLAKLLMMRYRRAVSERQAERFFDEARRVLKRVVKADSSKTAARTLLRELTGGSEPGSIAPRPRGVGP